MSKVKITINEGNGDRIFRVILGTLLVVVGLANLGRSFLPGWLGIILGLFGAIMLFAGVSGYCPLYTVFGFNTLRKRS